jgi:digeranylgeranylglycerophospholipid reductase
MKYDVVVVGGGYGGLIAAQQAAKQGAKTLLLEKEKIIGEHVRSTGAIHLKAIEAFNIDESVLANPVYGGKIYAPNGKSITLDFKKVSGYMTNKKAFFALLAKRAEESGVKIVTSSPVRDVIKEGDQIKGVVAESNGKKSKIGASIVVAADGMPSVVSKKTGLGVIKNFAVCKRYVVEGVDLESDKYTELLFLGSGSILGRGGWVFPFSKSIIDCGFGVLNSRMDRGLNFYANEFLNNPIIKEKIKGGKIVEEDTGFIPTTGPLPKTYGNGILAVGDAAGITDPITAEGIRYAMFSGEKAGKVAAEAVNQGDFSKSFLSKYEKGWKKEIGGRFILLKIIKKIAERCEDDDLNFLIENFQGDKFQEEGRRLMISKKDQLFGGYKKSEMIKTLISGSQDIISLARFLTLMLRIALRG